MNTLFWIMLVVATGFYHVEGCGTNNAVCITETIYQLCYTNGTEVVFVAGTNTCPSGTQCTEEGSYICTAVPDSTTASTTTVAPVTPPVQCNSSSVYPAQNCSQYYECVPFLWWYNLNLYSCPSGQAFNSAQLACVNDSSCDAATGEFVTVPSPRSDITTEAPVTPPAQCNSSSVYPAQNCSQYYECVPFLWWYNLNLISCPSGEAFNSTQLACVNDSSCDAATGEFATTTEITTVPTTTTPITTTTLAPVTPPAECNSSSVYPAQNCSQYYECVPFMWWYNLNLNSCPPGQAFNSTQLACVNDSSCDAVTGEFVTTESTTVPSTTTPITTTTTASPVTPPAQCNSSSVYPAQNCSQFYECVPFMWWYNLNLNSCPPGQAFNSTQQACVNDSACDAATGEFTIVTTTTTPITTTSSEPVATVSSTTLSSTSTSITTPTTTTPTTTTSTTTTTTPTTTSTPVITSTAASVTPPAQCNSSSVYPAQNCSQYYECTPFMWWYNLNTNSCPPGQAFSSTAQSCVDDTSCDAQTGEFVTGQPTVYTTTASSTSTSTTTSTTTTPTTTTPTTTTPTTTTSTTTTTTTTTTSTPVTTSTAAPVTPPAQCNSSSVYPAQNCSQYYECTPFLWWYNLNTISCPPGQAFSSTAQACVNDTSCDAQTGEFVTGQPTVSSTAASSIITTASSTTASTSSTITTPTTTTPTTTTPTTTTPTTTTPTTTTPTTTTPTTTTPTTTTPTTTTPTTTTPTTTTPTTTTPTTTTPTTTTPTTTTPTTTTPTTTTPTTTTPTTTTPTTTTPTTTTPTTTTPTTTTPTNTTTAVSVTPPASCTAPGNYEAESCNQYYQCVSVMWWYELVLQTCPSGQAYDSTTQACVASTTC